MEEADPISLPYAVNFFFHMSFRGLGPSNNTQQTAQFPFFASLFLTQMLLKPLHSSFLSSPAGGYVGYNMTTVAAAKMMMARPVCRICADAVPGTCVSVLMSSSVDPLSSPDDETLVLLSGFFDTSRQILATKLAESGTSASVKVSLLQYRRARGERAQCRD